MSNTEKSALFGMFDGLLKPFSSQEGAAAEPKPNISGSSALLESAVAELEKKKAELRRAREKQQDSAITFASENVSKSVGQIHGEILKDILALHAELKTPFDAAKLQSRRALLLELDGIASGLNGSTIENRVRAAVIRDVVGRCSKLAWSALQSILERSKVTWPEPTGLPPWAKEPEIAAAHERMVSEIAEAFFASTPARAADRMCGIVIVWKANYPDRDTPQWKTLVIQAVGYAILAELVCEATNKLRTESDALKAEAARMITTETANAQAALQGGVTSAEDIDKILGHVTELCEEAIPELAWATVLPIVDSSLKRVSG